MLGGKEQVTLKVQSNTMLNCPWTAFRHPFPFPYSSLRSLTILLPVSDLCAGIVHDPPPFFCPAMTSQNLFIVLFELDLSFKHKSLPYRYTQQPSWECIRLQNIIFKTPDSSGRCERLLCCLSRSMCTQSICFPQVPFRHKQGTKWDVLCGAALVLAILRVPALLRVFVTVPNALPGVPFRRPWIGMWNASGLSYCWGHVCLAHSQPGYPALFCQQTQFPLSVALIDPSERVSPWNGHNCPFIKGQKSRMICTLHHHCQFAGEAGICEIGRIMKLWVKL